MKKLIATILLVCTLCSCGIAHKLENLPTTEQIPNFPTEVVEKTEIRTSVKERANRPTEFELSSSYDDLIFYSTSKSAEEIIASLPTPKTVYSQEEFISSVSPREEEYGFWKLVETDGSQPFDKALSVTVDTLPDTPYSFQLSLGKEFLSQKGKDDDVMLIEFTARAKTVGTVGVVVEMSGSNGRYDKAVTREYTLSDEWTTFYAPFAYDSNYPSVNLRFGYMLQEIELGGFNLYNYENTVTLSELPVNIVSPEPSLTREAEWRDEALERIEEVRKGDIDIVVLDCWGVPLSDVDVNVEMYEHEFEWGTAVNSSILSNEKLQYNVSRYFNSAVLENELKWRLFEDNKKRPIKMIELLGDLGISRVRGHCLVWDRDRRENDSSVPADLPSLYSDREAMTERIRAHIEEIMTATDGLVFEWDVLNEACNNTTMQDIYGRELIKEWFDMALEYGGQTNLYYNDFMTGGQLFDLLDVMEELGVVYDGIGIQSHYSTPRSMEQIYDFYKKVASYGKTLKVTEYDFDTSDEYLRAEFTRDLMILTFSVEEFEGFYLWGIRGGKYVCFDNDWTPRLALAQMEDLIYNKWMTRETVTTNSQGLASLRGFYGSYKITVNAAGIKKTVYVDCHKGNDNTIYIEMS